MVVSNKPIFLDGIWGPYYSVMIPNMWLTEGGQSATGNNKLFYEKYCILLGSLLDYIILNHSANKELIMLAEKFGKTS